MKPAPAKPQAKAIEMPQKISAPAPAPAPEPSAPAEKNDIVLVAPTPNLNPRNLAMESIAKRSNADADAAAHETITEGDGESAPVEAASAPAAEPSAEAPAESATPAPAVAGQAESAPAPSAVKPAIPGIDPNADYDFVVDGAQMKIKGSQVIARIQKGEAADHRLNLASRLLDEAKRTVAQPAQLPAEGAAQPREDASQPAALDEAQLAQLIQYGTHEQAAAAIKALRAQRPDTVTQQGLQTFIAQQLPRVVEGQIAFREGLALVRKDYGDLLEDPDLRQLFIIKENAARQAGDKRPHAELYKAIGDDIRKRFAQGVPAAAPTSAAAPARTIEDKQAAKAAAPAAPRLASARLDSGAGAQKPKSREDIINEVRKSRGQHALGVR